jgi:hypothetical protein
LEKLEKLNIRIKIKGSANTLAGRKKIEKLEATPEINKKVKFLFIEI